jgi:Family of unknown function (DUF6157)
MNYYNTLIEVAEDCPVSKAEVPHSQGTNTTKPMVEYEILTSHPYEYTEEDIGAEIYARMHATPAADWPEERQTFVSKGHPHFRVSALAKRYGWGIHSNAEGKAALVAVESAEYRNLARDPHTTKIRAFRSKRA